MPSWIYSTHRSWMEVPASWLPRQLITEPSTPTKERDSLHSNILIPSFTGCSRSDCRENEREFVLPSACVCVGERERQIWSVIGVYVAEVYVERQEVGIQIHALLIQLSVRASSSWGAMSPAWLIRLMSKIKRMQDRVGDRLKKKQTWTASVVLSVKLHYRDEHPSTNRHSLICAQWLSDMCSPEVQSSNFNTYQTLRCTNTVCQWCRYWPSSMFFLHYIYSIIAEHQHSCSFRDVCHH